jgi:hypothetical protein
MSFVVAPELVNLLHHILLLLPKNIWHAINVTDDFQPTIYNAIGLVDCYYEKLLLKAGVFKKHGAITTTSLLHLEHLKAELQENISIHLTKEQVPHSRKKCTITLLAISIIQH